ncbi:ATP-binding protein [Listeria portnoyi]|uniref:ATP-binding protein n=1 Tax=Listeria portnoyi TaxID=2713504 RepID=UPI001C9C13A4|nr:ATP-binding protein [Listeria portnoyi]
MGLCEDTIKLKLGALLFFGKYESIIDKMPHFHLDYQNKTAQTDWRWIDRVATGELKYPNLNLFKFYNIVLEKLKTTVLESFELDEKLLRKTSNEIDIALREALANSLIHADYFTDRDIKIEAYNNNYEFTNPGEMKISEEEFAQGGDSQPRNHTIATLFRRVGISERAGSGGPKIFQAAINNKFRSPELRSGGGMTQLKIWKVDLVDAHPELNANEKTVLRFISKEDVISISKLKTTLGLSEYHAKVTLNSLLSKELIYKEGNGRSTVYRLPDSNSQRIANLEQMIREVQDMYVQNNKK